MILQRRNNLNHEVMKDDLGDFVSRIQAIPTRAKSKARNWFLVITVLSLSLIVTNAVTYMVINNALLKHRTLDSNVIKKFEVFDNPMPGIIRDTIPFVQEWYRDLDNHEDLLQAETRENIIPFISSNNDEDIDVNPPSSQCLETYFDDMAKAVPDTTPRFVELVLQNLGLSTEPLIRKALGNLLKRPQPLFGNFDAAKQCLGSMKGAAELVCVFSSEGEDKWNLTNVATRTVLEYSLNQAAVYDRLTLKLQDDLPALFEVINVMNFKRKAEIESINKANLQGSKLEFALAKYRSMASYMTLFGKAISENEILKSKASLQLNILEAVKLDAINGHIENARVGLALAAAVYFEGFTEGNHQKWRLGKEWVDSYIVWNMVFVSSTLPWDALGKLIIPSISCASSDSYLGEVFISRRVVSLSLHLMHSFSITGGEKYITSEEVIALQNFYASQRAPDIPIKRFHLIHAMGNISLKTASIANPSQKVIEKMLYTLCGESCHEESWKITSSNPVSKLNATTFQLYVGFILLITCVFAGIGLELLVGLLFLRNGWTEGHEHLWRLAQFSFPLLAAVMLGLSSHQNYSGLIILVIAVWKFGFPETIMIMYFTLHYRDLSKISRLRHFLDAVGTIVHHTASAMLVCMIISGNIRPDQSIFEPVSVLLMQHWIVLVKYINKTAYCVVATLLEVWFEWEVFSNFEKYHANHWTLELLAGTMLVAHWMFFIAGGLSMIVNEKNHEQKYIEENSDDEAILHTIRTDYNTTQHDAEV